MSSQIPAEPLLLDVGAIVAYECLLDEAAGTTSWRVGAVRALPASSPSHSVNHSAVAHAAHDGLYRAEDDAVVVSSSGQPTPLPATTACQTVLIQPWISLAAGAADVSQDSAAAAEDKARSTSPHPQQPPSQQQQQQQAVSPAVRFAEIDAMQRELEEIQRFARGESKGAREGTAGDEDEEEEEDEEDRLAKTLSQAYSRVLASSSQSPRPPPLGESGISAEGDARLGASQSLNENGIDANPELTRQIEAKRAEFRKRIEQIVAEMKKTRKQQRDLQEAQANAEKSLNDARAQLREAQDKVQKIDIRALREIQGYRLPPAVVKLVMSAVLCVLGEKAATWQDVVTAMRGSSFISNVVTFDPSQLTASRLQELRRSYISNPHFSHEDAVKGSQALGQFHEWVMRQVQLIDADGNFAKFRTEKEASAAALAETRQKMEADAAELKHLEEELDALLHERVRQQEEHLKSTSQSVLSPHSPASAEAAAAVAEKASATRDDAASQQQQQRQMSTGAPHTHSRQLSIDSAEGDNAASRSPAATSSRLRAAAAGVSASNNASVADTSAAAGDLSAGPRASSTVAQQQQVLALIPPGSQWVCPPAGAVHSTYVLRSSILCVLAYTSDEHDSMNNNKTTSTSQGPSATGNVSTVSASNDIFELSEPQQHFIVDAMQQPLNERPPMPLTADEAAVEAARRLREQQARDAAEAARRTTVTSHHVKSFDGEEWAMVVEDSAKELRRALVEDLAAICQVPNRSILNVEWVLGSLHVQCDVRHTADVDVSALQQRVEEGPYPAVMALYEGRQRVRDSLDEDAAREMQQASRLALMEEEIQAAQQAEADARKELEKARQNFERQQQELAEQIAVAQTSSQMDYLDEAREHLALREAMQDVQSALKEREAQIARLQARLHSLQQEAQTAAEEQRAAARRVEERHAAEMAALERKLAEQAAQTSQTASAEAAEQLAKMTKELAEEKARAAAAQQQAEAEQRARLQEAEKAQQQLAAATKEAEARTSFTSTHHTKTFDGDGWAVVVDDCPELLRRALEADVADISEVPPSAVANVQWTLGSLHVDFDVRHCAAVSHDALQQRLDQGDYPTVAQLYKDSLQRHAAREADAAAAAQRTQQVEELTQQLQEAVAAQAALQHSLQAMELTRTAATERAEQQQQEALNRARQAAEQTVQDLTRQLHAAQAALAEEEERHQKEMAEAQAREAAFADGHGDTQRDLDAARRDLEATRQELRVANDNLKKLEVQTRKDAMEAEKKLAAVEKAQQQQKAAEVKTAEKATAELERKLRAAQAALQEQGKLHHAEVVKLLAQLAMSESALRQLQDEHTAQQSAAQREEEKQRELTDAQSRAADAHAALIAAVTSQKNALEAAAQHCEEATQRQSEASAAAAACREQRRASLEGIREKVRALASTAEGDDGEEDNGAQETSAALKESLARDLAALLAAAKKAKDDADADVAQSRSATAAKQQLAEQAGSQVAHHEKMRAEAKAKHCALRAAAEGDANRAAAAAANGTCGENDTNGAASAAQEVEEDAELAALSADVAAAAERFVSAYNTLTEAEERRLQACVEEAEDMDRMLRGADMQGSSDVSQLMREVHELATKSFLQRHQTAWMHTCLCSLLLTAVATLQYKKYAV